METGKSSQQNRSDRACVIDFTGQVEPLIRLDFPTLDPVFWNGRAIESSSQRQRLTSKERKSDDGAEKMGASNRQNRNENGGDSNRNTANLEKHPWNHGPSNSRPASQMINTS